MKRKLPEVGEKLIILLSKSPVTFPIFSSLLPVVPPSPSSGHDSNTRRNLLKLFRFTGLKKE
jgi:hypothetical protein